MSTYMSYYVTWDANHFSLNSYKYRLCLLRGSGGQRKSFQRMRWFHGCIFELTVAYGIGIDSFLAAGIYFLCGKYWQITPSFQKLICHNQGGPIGLPKKDQLCKMTGPYMWNPAAQQEAAKFADGIHTRRDPSIDLYCEIWLRGASC